MTRQELAAMIDHTILKADATHEDVRKATQIAIDCGCKSIAINGSDTKFCSLLTAGTNTLVDTAIGDFPLGRVPITCKVFETEQAVLLGAGEIDMIMNVGAFKECAPDYLLKEVSEVVKAAKGLPVKVILETCYLTDAEKIKAAKICADAGASFVKTSTGFGTAGATVHDVELLRKAVPDHVKVKASGGIRTWKDAKALIEAGADRLGMSATVKVLEEFDPEH